MSSILSRADLPQWLPQSGKRSFLIVPSQGPLHVYKETVS
jgi:hypothetical protein